MPYISADVIEQAKKIDLLSYFKIHDPGELVPLGRDVFSLRSHGSLKISNGLWHWFSRGIGGRSALDYLIKVEGFSFTDAVARLADRDARQKDFFLSRKAKPIEKEPRTLLLPEIHKDNNRVIRYLEDKRGIDPAIVEMFILSGSVYESEYKDMRSGRTFANAVFLGYDSDGAIHQASIRGIDSGYKSEAAGSDKRYSFSFLPETGSETIHIFESAIDLMSYVTLEKIYCRSSSRAHYVSLSGVYRPRQDAEERRLPLALEHFITEHPEIQNAKIHLDNDEAGKMAAIALAVAFQTIGIKAINAPPKEYKDYNDYLRHIEESAETGRDALCRS